MPDRETVIKGLYILKKSYEGFPEAERVLEEAIALLTEDQRLEDDGK